MKIFHSRLFLSFIVVFFAFLSMSGGYAVGKMDAETQLKTIIETLSAEGKLKSAINEYAKRFAITRKHSPELLSAVLYGVIKSQKDTLVINAAEILCQLGEKDAPLTVLREMICADNKLADWDNRGLAGRVFGKYADAESFHQIQDALKGMIANPSADGIIYALGFMGENAVPILEEALKAESEDTKKRAVVALARIGGTEAASVLHDALKDEGLFWRASNALVGLGDDRVIPIIIQGLEKHLIPYTLFLALRSRMKIDSIHVPALQQAIGVEDHGRLGKVPVAYALATMGDEKSKDLLHEELKSKKNLFAAYALAMLGEKSVVPTLVDILKNPRRWLPEHNTWYPVLSKEEGETYCTNRIFIIEALANVLEDKNLALVKDLMKKTSKIDMDTIAVEEGMTHILLSLSGQATVPMLQKLLTENRTTGGEYVLVRALVDLCDKSHIPLIQGEIGKMQTVAGEAIAVQALARLCDQSDLPLLQRTLKRVQTTRSRIEIIDALVRLGGDNAASLVFNELKTTLNIDEQASVYATGTLFKLVTKSAI